VQRSIGLAHYIYDAGMSVEVKKVGTQRRMS